MEDIANYSIFETPPLFLLGEKANLKQTTKQTENPQLFFGSAGACFCVQLEEDILSLCILTGRAAGGVGYCRVKEILCRGRKEMVDFDEGGMDTASQESSRESSSLLGEISVCNLTQPTERGN